MQNCGPIERIYTSYEKGNINGLHLIAELYDNDRFYERWRTNWLTGNHWTDRRHWILYPQLPHGRWEAHPSGTWTSIDEQIKFNYDNYFEGRDPRYWKMPSEPD